MQQLDARFLVIVQRFSLGSAFTYVFVLLRHKIIGDTLVEHPQSSSFTTENKAKPYVLGQMPPQVQYLKNQDTAMSLEIVILVGYVIACVTGLLAYCVKCCPDSACLIAKRSVWIYPLLLAIVLGSGIGILEWFWELYNLIFIGF
jgi:hypothetical protein